MTENQVIPEAAVEAAARAGYEYQYSSLEGKWDFANPRVQEDFRNEFHAALEAAAPHMRTEPDTFADRMARRSLDALDDTWRKKQ